MSLTLSSTIRYQQNFPITLQILYVFNWVRIYFSLFKNLPIWMQ